MSMTATWRTPADIDGVAYVRWDDWLASWSWAQGEHVTLIGPTGVGKTTLAEAILPRRRFALIIATKPRDASLRRYAADGGYRIVRRWRDVRSPWTDALGRSHGDERVILWPQFRSISDRPRQAEEITAALGETFAAGGWAIYLDEARYVSELSPDLGQWLDTLWMQGRSMGVSVVAGTQRPRWVSLSALSQARWVILWRTADGYDLRRVGELGSADAATISTVVSRLPAHEALVVDTRTGALVRTRAPR